MFNIGPGELMAIAAVALIVLGPQRLPQAVRSVGRVLGELRRISGGFQEELRRAIDESELDEADEAGDTWRAPPAAPVADGPVTTEASAAQDDDEPEPMLLPSDAPEPEPRSADGDDQGGDERAVS